MRFSPSFYSERETSMIKFFCDPRKTTSYQEGARWGTDEGPAKMHEEVLYGDGKSA